MSARPVIKIRAGDMPEVVDQIDLNVARVADDVGLYLRGGVVTCVWRLPDAEVDRRQSKKAPICREAGSIKTTPATQSALEDLFTRNFTFLVWRESQKDEVRIDCPAKAVKWYLARASSLSLPKLLGTIEAPIMREDGSFLATSGYDRQTGLYLDTSVKWELPTELTFDAAKASVEILCKPFEEFPLGDDPIKVAQRRSVIVAASITAIQRRLLPTAPAFVFDAARQESGKTLLSDCISLIALGRNASSTSVDSSPEEFKKKFIAILLEGDPLMVFDNITAALSSDVLATALTKDTYKGRILGLSQTTGELPTNLTVILNGNNIVLSGDMPSRCLVARIEPNIERPGEQKFKLEEPLREHVARRRVELVKAVLTILGAHHAAGCPQPTHLKPYGNGRFDAWAAQVRAAMVWCGMADPCATRDDIEQADPERDAMLALYTAWYAAFGDRDVTAQGVIEAASGKRALHEALTDVAADPKRQAQLSARQLGAYIRGRKGAVVDFHDDKGQPAGSLKPTDGVGTAHGGLKKYRIVKIKQQQVTTEGVAA